MAPSLRAGSTTPRASTPHSRGAERSVLVDLQGVRRITDDHDTLWEVWEAHPRLAERRRMRDRRARTREGVHDRRSPDSDHLPPATEPGWLVFRSLHQERRRTPIPEHWELMTDDQLRAVLRKARITGPVARVRR